MIKKTAAIYDRWLYTLGGGEQVAFAYARALADFGYQVELLTHRQVSVEAAEQKMGIDLTDIKLKYLQERSSMELAEISEGYDLFINNSHLDYFPNRAQLGILSVFFPGIIRLTIFEYLKRALLIPSFKNIFIYPSYFEGFKYDEPQSGKIYKWLSPTSSIVFKDDIEEFKIKLFFKNLTYSVLDQINFYLDDEELTSYQVAIQVEDNTATFNFNVSHLLTGNRRFIIDLPDNFYSEKIALLSLTIPSLRFFLYNLFKHRFPLWEMRLHGGPGITRRSDLESYQHIVTISEFCQDWIHRYWGLKSKILYPPVNTEQFLANQPKKNQIIHIGRFFVTGHSKKQLAMVKIFKKLSQRLNSEDWELHFIGSIADGKKHRDYFKACQAEAAGYPIHFHTETSFTELRDLLAESKIYWHATGLDENEDKNPIVFEHFGITTVEAMASGCVPVVIKAGGQKEIVTEGCGFTWENRHQWLRQTKRLMTNHELWQKLSRGAIQRSQYFSRDNFKKRFKEIIKDDLA